MNEIADPKHIQLAAQIRDLLSTYYENFDLISIGAYKSGSNKKIDKAIQCIDNINNFLKQDVNEKYTYEDTVKLMESLI
jgi:flagellum-specific ATP synthase